jgi:type II secretory pathway pseudopilin PulG
VTGDERGFTVVQLILATAVIGAIGVALLFSVVTGKKSNLDAHAKSSAQQVVSRLQACYAQTPSYESCANAGFGTATVEVVLDNTVPASGRVSVVASTGTTFTVVASSRSSNFFVVSKDLTGLVVRSCGPIVTPYGIATGSESGGCSHGNTW